MKINVGGIDRILRILVGVAGRAAIGHGLVPVLPRVPAAGYQYLSAQARLSAYFLITMQMPCVCRLFGLCFKVRTFTLLAFCHDAYD